MIFHSKGEGFSCRTSAAHECLEVSGVVGRGQRSALGKWSLALFHPANGNLDPAGWNAFNLSRSAAKHSHGFAADHEHLRDRERNVGVNALLNAPLGTELIRIAITGSFFLLGLGLGWALGKWRHYRQLREAERGEAREVLTIEKILVNLLPDA